MEKTIATPTADRERSQRTVSIIGDVSVAVSEAVERSQTAPPQSSWKSLLLFAALFYAGCAAAAWLAVPTLTTRQFLLISLLPAVCGALLFRMRQQWKSRAKAAERKLKIWQQALDVLGHETANGINAVRANLIGFRQTHREISSSEHLDQVERATRRMESALRQSRDPITAKIQRSKGPEV